MKKCLTCSEYKNCKDSFASWTFFIIGLVATVAVRVVTVLMHLNPIYAKIAWYIGISGFLLFFLYKFQVGKSRARAINELNIVDKINKEEKLREEDYRLISAILCGLSSRKERLNYMFIFGLSAVTLLIALYMDFLK